MKKIAIIGAGYTGMSAADSLCGTYKVDVFESAAVSGGMAATFDFFGVPLEYFYRHIFKSDTYVTELAERLGLGNDLEWPLTKMGYFSKGRIYEFGTPKSLLMFKPLTIWDKFRFGLSIIKIKGIKSHKSLEGITAYEWMRKNAGENAFEVVWEPLLKLKFGDKYKEVSMSWLWGKIALRGSSGSADGERLGYIKGSYGRLSEAYESDLKKRGVVFKFNCKAEKISKTDNGKYIISTQNGSSKEYDRVILTTSYPEIIRIAGELLTDNEKGKLASVEYTATRCMVLSLNKSFMPFYWMNNGDSAIPFGGIIEHTRMIKPEVYGGRHILYISNYLESESQLYSCPDEELLQTYIPYLKKINPDFDRKWIEAFYTYREQYAQPVIRTGYSSDMVHIAMDSSGIFVASMPQIYPEDRGLNYAIRLGRQVANEVKQKL